MWEEPISITIMIAGASHMGGDVLSLSTNSSKAKGKVKCQLRSNETNELQKPLILSMACAPVNSRLSSACNSDEYGSFTEREKTVISHYDCL